MLSLFFALLADPVVVEFNKLKTTIPDSWKSEKPANRLRSHQFKLASDDKDFADAELIILPESNPSPDKAYPGWIKTFDAPDGKKLEDVTKKTKFEAGKAVVHVLDISGTWNYRERPQDPKSKLEVRPEYRAIWMIVVVGDEASHVRFSGPQKVVEKHEKDVMTWIKSMK
jgi:hypothetical protein